jgi:hypothetical protein
MDEEGCANESGCGFSCAPEKFSHIFCKAAQTSQQDHGISWATFGMVEIIPKVRHRELLFGSFGVQHPSIPYGGKDRDR